MKKQSVIIVVIAIVVLALVYTNDNKNREKRGQLFKDASRIETQITELEEIITNMQGIKAQLQGIIDRASPHLLLNSEARELYGNAKSNMTKLLSEEQEIIERYKAKILEYNDIVAHFNSLPRGILFEKSDMPHKMEKHREIEPL